MMIEFTRTDKIITSLLILICGMTACGGSQSPKTIAVGPAARARADLLQIPPELAGKNPVDQGLAYIDVVNELQAETSNPRERHFHVKTGPIFSARGWAFDDKRNTAPPVWLQLVGKSADDRIFLPAKRMPSKELAVGFHHPWAALASFTVLIEQAANIPPGTYEATIFQADPDVLIKTPFYSVQRITMTVE